MHALQVAASDKLSGLLLLPHLLLFLRNTELITTIKIGVVRAPGASTIKLFRP
jgi:hypothetical protein